MQRAGAAERDEREVARIEAALDRHQADRVGHVRFGDRDDAERRVLEGHAERLRDPCVDRLVRERAGRAARAAQEVDRR